MRAKLLILVLVSLMCLVGCSAVEEDQEPIGTAHDMNAPRPPVVTPGKTPADPPSHAIVLFDGTDLSEWVNEDDGPPEWIVKEGYVQVNETGIIKTKKEFGSCHLHIEWATPAEVEGRGQGRGNSGVYFMSNYEVQVLDSYNNDTYPDGQAAAIYGRNAPLVNASRPPGEWQTYDIVFHRPVFENDKVVRRASFTVFHNGVLVQDHFKLQGGTHWINEHTVADYEPHPDKLPLVLQDHDNPIRFRNIWIVELDD
ncbi:MAG: 3-keto-disaccharide hydrolase [Planctomycetota bacterium]